MENDAVDPKIEAVAFATNVILRALNRSNGRAIAQAIYDTVAKDHRSTQQLFWSAMLLAQIEYATDPFDGRNMEAVKLANRVKEMAIVLNYDHGLPYK